MEITVTTPSLLFPAISLLMLAYTNRFVVLANVIRQLSNLEDAPSKAVVIRQIHNLRIRMKVIRLMQAFGVLSFVLCTLSMFALLLGWAIEGKFLFAASLIFLVISLLFSFYEVNISTTAINIELEKFDEKLHEHKKHHHP
ncbi:DUF2721 domain-containing protein [Cellvibrio japonicus]|uniref:II family cellulose-binding protein n=1 Tax=Cellvibrio japonicus (strain Ueda107) TaxID=498211 RepID=B3PKB6_CELJU|nr:DUF2721 domain-containing protein [Cellvibrio japonicus]ACE84879.1 hypothetical protein CJA_2384 [Cellvibrio japonicus Ueda107]QEI12789.1 DUF2721 domain-containing protein [Cellvibrio japonicus]QEI16363.1 DUF2721 domain-containing protein [Cellvibrio japonicus]QEI19941.1 DUF2721 domain-containing protein [Cellvibrio japonicus]